MVNYMRLPPPVQETYAWQYDAACLGMEAERFFSPPGERGAARQWRERGAKAICATCPVIEACLAHALAVPEEHGVWGGLTVEERSALRAEKRAG